MARAMRKATRRAALRTRPTAPHRSAGEPILEEGVGVAHLHSRAGRCACVSGARGSAACDSGVCVSDARV
eukprot:3561778-Prymnesium_polylepis.1